LESNLKKLGDRKNYLLEIFSSLVLFLISFFFIFWSGSYFEFDIFPLENRSTIFTTFHIFIFDKYVDAVIIILLTNLWLYLSINGKKRIISAICFGSLTSVALLTDFNLLLDFSVFVSIPIIISFFVYQYFSAKKILQVRTNMFMSFFSISLLCIAVVGAIVTILVFSLNFGPTQGIKNYSKDIFLLFSSFSPVLIFLLIMGSGIKLLTNKTIRKLKIETWQQNIPSYNVKHKNKILLLFILLSIFFALIPHQSFINNENEIVGADTVDYVKRLQSLRVDDQGEIIRQAFVVQNSGDRPLSLLLLSTVLTIFPDNPYHVIDHMPIIFSPLLVLAVFFLTREITSNDTISLLASFLTAISFHPLIGIYSGLYANWLALTFGYLSFVFLFRILKRPKSTNYLVFSILLFLVMFTHVYTWFLLILFMGIFLIVSYRLKMFQRKRVALVFLIIVASFAFDTGKSLMTDTPVILERYAIIVNQSSSSESLPSIWSNLFQTTLVYAGGQFGNFLILSLCIYWLLRSNFNQMCNLFIAIFLSIAILPFLFGGDVIQSRVLYVIPFQIPAAIGLTFLVNQQRGILLVFGICLWILIMSIQAVVNFI